jgi:membrane-associated protease RseP (regulator of RpoE activity)
MNDESHLDGEIPPRDLLRSDEQYVIPTVVDETPQQTVGGPPRIRRRRVRLPALLFIATCLSTLLVGGWAYALPVMTILICHEAGHFLQARRYGVHASLPYFIPMPLFFIGTMGAVIAMDARNGDRRAMFDIGITGPLAGLVPTIVFCVVGLQLSKVDVPTFYPDALPVGEPLILTWLVRLTFGDLPPGHDVFLHPLAKAGWVGLLVTALNLFPIGQLDGGHILYALLRKKAHGVATLLLLGAVAAVFIGGFWHPRLWGWWLMLVLLILIGPKHPPTANDDVPLGTVRHVLGWLTLAFLPLGFTPIPFPASF